MNYQRKPLYTKKVEINISTHFCFHSISQVLRLRRERDSNPRSLSAQRFSRPPQSTTLPSLQRAQNTRFSKSAAKVQQILDIRKFFCKKMVECLQFSVLLVLFGHLFDGRDIVVILRCNLLNIAFMLRICYVYVTYILRK